MNQLSRFWLDAKYALGKRTVFIFIVLVILRLVSLGIYPLMDMTEGRYGEIARKMAEMNDWVTPWYDVGVPFWGKPPLSFWMSALGIKLFGINEFAVRFPHFLAALLVTIICYDWAKRSLINPFYVVIILSTSFIFLVSSGAVMTDMALCVGSTLSLRAFWLSLRGKESDRKREQYLFFTGLSIMLLAKGPVGWVLVLLPLGLWALLTKSIKETWQGLAWIVGSILAIVVVLPWYFLAEQHTPGFLNYFFIGEHWHRFTVSGWKGDLYGSAHATQRGTIWLQFIYATLPWSLILPIAAWIYKKQSITKSPVNQQLSLYLLLAAIAPCLFFTMSGNILWTYVLPGLPALALLFALWLGRMDQILTKKIILFGTATSAVIVISVLSILTIGHAADLKSAKSITQLYEAQNIVQKSIQPLVFLSDRPYSAMFYSHGLALKMNTLEEVSLYAKGNPTYIAVRKNQLTSLKEQLGNLKAVGDAGNYRLFLMPNRI
jgi:4-amino-4-deoxy-L-arabinose transferase-like glycosyltransferase